MKNFSNNEKLIGALLLGAAVGGVLGILFAPDKGSETRKKITDKAEDLTGTVKEKFNAFLEEVTMQNEKMKHRINDFSGNGKTKVDNVNIN